SLSASNSKCSPGGPTLIQVTQKEQDTQPLEEIVTPKPNRKPPLPALTGIRTLLAFNIVLFHFTPSHLGPLYAVVNNGYVFVNVFFLISGYILTYNYSDRAATLVKCEFWPARCSPPYPVFLLAPSV